MVGSLTSLFAKDRPLSRANPNMNRTGDQAAPLRPSTPQSFTPETVAALPPPGTSFPVVLTELNSQVQVLVDSWYNCTAFEVLSTVIDMEG